MLQKVAAENDSYPTEVYSDRIGVILAGWRAELLDSPQKTTSVERVMSANFTGASPHASLKPRRRNDGCLQVWQAEFGNQTVLGKDAFLAEWRKSLAVFSKLLTVDFQIVAIHADEAATPAPSATIRVHTRIRYEFVGLGNGFQREQWVGHADLEWVLGAGPEVRLLSWSQVEETRSRALAPILEDRAPQVFGVCESFHAQFSKGVDYWRTALDAASGIDIYGHNGLAVGDIDGDGLDDLYICQPAGLPNRMYRNRGDGTFEDVTQLSGTGLLDNTACALFADINNTGRQDLILVRASGPLLFLNQGGGKFRLQPSAFQFANPPQGTFTGAAIADYDCDGWLDIYFCLYSYYQGADQYRYPTPYYAAENGPPNFLMRNLRDGTFRDVTSETGLNHNNQRFSFCCAWSDFNGDGWPDLYVVNDFGRKNLYRNNGNGTFTDIAKEAGVEDVGAGMSVSCLDYDTDGLQDLYVADMWTAAGLRVSMQDKFQQNASEDVRALYRRHAMGNCLYRSRGDGSFDDVGPQSGTLMGRWAWSSDSWDLDHDGFPEIYIANGMISGPLKNDLNSFFWRQIVAKSPLGSTPSTAYEQGWNAINELIRADATWSGYERNLLYLNNGDGTFSDVSGAAAVDFLEDGRTMAFADFDGDGRVEAVLKNRNAPQLRFLKNVIPELPPAIAFRLTGKQSNRDAIGARVTIETSTGLQTRFVQAGSGFLAQHSKELFFGLGQAQGRISATIRWPSGLLQHLDNLPANHRIWVEEGSHAFRKEPFAARTENPHQSTNGIVQSSESLPEQVETWLLAPVAAPDFLIGAQNSKSKTLTDLRGKPVLLCFTSSQLRNWSVQLENLQRLEQEANREGFQLLVLDAEASSGGKRTPEQEIRPGSELRIVAASQDTLAVYNILFTRLFDRHRDMSLPAAFLLDPRGDIVKIYQGLLPIEQVTEDARHIPATPTLRLQRGLPFPGVADSYEIGRNYLSFGAIFYERGYLEQSEAYFRLAQKDDPNGAEALYGLGSVYLEMGKNQEARGYFNRATRAQANYPGTMPNTWNNLGILSAREGRTDEAIGYFQKALEFNPDNPVALENLGNAFRQKKNWSEARNALERALFLRPDDAESNYSLAMVYAQTGDTVRAHDYLQKALALRPAYPEALNNLGILYLRTRRPEDAEKSFRESIRLAPEYDPAYLNLARLYAMEGETARARSVLEDLLKIHPDQVQARQELQSLSQ